MTGRMTGVELKAEGLSLTVDAAAIRQIVPAPALRRVPLTRRQVHGVLVRDGRAIPVYRLEFMAAGLAEPPARRAGSNRSDPADQIVIVEHDGALAGILVESTDPVRTGTAAPEGAISGRTLLVIAGILENDHGQQAAQTAGGDA